MKRFWKAFAGGLGGLALLAGCSNSSGGPLPDVVFTSPSSTFHPLTTNASDDGVTALSWNRNFAVQGRIENTVGADVASAQVVNDLGAFPNAAPGQFLSLGADGTFSINLNDPLVNTTFPLVEGDNGNAVIVRASNENSPLDAGGSPIPAVRAIRIFVQNQVEFTNPVYADVGIGGTPTFDCDLEGNPLTGTFTLPAGTTDANDVITAPTGANGAASVILVVRTQANLYENIAQDILADPFNETLDAAQKDITINTDGTFSVNVDNTGWHNGSEAALPSYDPLAEAQIDRNFFIRFHSENDAALPAGDINFATFPFRNCDLAP
ncbi:MAG: hypothetical protein AB1405_06430 [Bdellovibrionota bacterium]